MSDHNPLHTFAPHDLAGMFDVSVMTIRRWAEYHAAHLSAGANPTSGQSRRFTWADVETMRKIKAWRDNGLSVDAINVKLTEDTAEANTAVTVADSIESPADTRQGQETGILAIQVLDAINAQNRKIEALERSARPGWWLFVAGVLCGLGFAAVAELFALLARR